MYHFCSAVPSLLEVNALNLFYDYSLYEDVAEVALELCKDNIDAMRKLILKQLKLFEADVYGFYARTIHCADKKHLPKLKEAFDDICEWFLNQKRSATMYFQLLSDTNHESLNTLMNVLQSDQHVHHTHRMGWYVYVQDVAKVALELCIDAMRTLILKQLKLFEADVYGFYARTIHCADKKHLPKSKKVFDDICEWFLNQKRSATMYFQLLSDTNHESLNTLINVLQSDQHVHHTHRMIKLVHLKRRYLPNVDSNTLLRGGVKYAARKTDYMSQSKTKADLSMFYLIPESGLSFYQPNRDKYFATELARLAGYSAELPLYKTKIPNFADLKEIDMLVFEQQTREDSLLKKKIRKPHDNFGATYIDLKILDNYGTTENNDIGEHRLLDYRSSIGITGLVNNITDIQKRVRKLHSQVDIIQQELTMYGKPLGDVGLNQFAICLYGIRQMQSFSEIRQQDAQNDGTKKEIASGEDTGVGSSDSDEGKGRQKKHHEDTSISDRKKQSLARWKPILANLKHVKELLLSVQLTTQHLENALSRIKRPSVPWYPNCDVLLSEIRTLGHKTSFIGEYFNRLHSFLLGENVRNKVWNNKGFVWAGPLASAGFSYEGEADIVVCKHCNCRSDTSKWRDNDEDYAFAMHREGQKGECPFLDAYGKA